MQKQDRVGLLNLAPGPFDPDLFDCIVADAQSRGVDHVQRHTFDLDGLADHVAGGAGNRSNDRKFRAGQRVQERTLAAVRLAGDDHPDALPQQRPLPGTLHHPAERLLQPLELALRIGLLQKIDLLFGKIERGLHQHAQLDQRIAQRMDLGRELPRQRPAGAAGGGLGVGVDQVGDRLGLRQVDLVVQESAFGEFARLCHAQSDGGTSFDAARQQQLQHHRSAMGLQFQHVFAGV